MRFTRNIFQCVGDGAYLVVAGHDAEIDRNEFRNKSTVGNMIDVRGSGRQIAQRVWIHHNYFHDFTNAGANGAETIRFGLSGLSLSNGFGVIEHNLFIRCNGENELISVKSSSNTIRYNTILDSPGTQLTLRHGNDGLVYGNYLLDNTTHYVMSGRTNGLGATDTTFVNNIIQGGGVVADINGPYGGAVWDDNILWNTGGAGDMPAGGFATQNPLLARDANGGLRRGQHDPVRGQCQVSLPARGGRAEPLVLGLRDASGGIRDRGRDKLRVPQRAERGDEPEFPRHLDGYWFVDRMRLRDSIRPQLSNRLTVTIHGQHLASSYPP